MRSSRATLRLTQTFTWDVIYISIGPPDNPMFFYENDKTRVVVEMGVGGGMSENPNLHRQVVSGLPCKRPFHVFPSSIY